MLKSYMWFDLTTAEEIMENSVIRLKLGMQTPPNNQLQAFEIMHPCDCDYIDPTAEDIRNKVEIQVICPANSGSGSGSEYERIFASPAIDVYKREFGATFCYLNAAEMTRYVSELSKIIAERTSECFLSPSDIADICADSAILVVMRRKSTGSIIGFTHSTYIESTPLMQLRQRSLTKPPKFAVHVFKNSATFDFMQDLVKKIAEGIGAEFAFVSKLLRCTEPKQMRS